MKSDKDSKQWEEKLKSMSKEELISEAIKWHEAAKGNFQSLQELKEKFKKVAVLYCWNTDLSSDMD